MTSTVTPSEACSPAVRPQRSRPCSRPGRSRSCLPAAAPEPALRVRVEAVPRMLPEPERREPLPGIQRGLQVLQSPLRLKKTIFREQYAAS
ncbi:hypothetical protein L596_029259 [Steinernema carpocapsae]|uniref:Uncharacterized protein n=1 Tax=Steinernema carpocapsae TaxID=34508 RepID=A0A4U5LU46_STECR|nr:hypothetical protein L596_029259 [Steinernema carpocapsae]